MAPKHPDKKPYSRDLDVENTPKAIKLISECMVATGEFRLHVPIEDQKPKGDIGDFAIQRLSDEEKLLVEVERKTVWEISGAWPQQWRTLDVPARHNNTRSIYCAMINDAWDTIIFMKMADVLKYRPRRKIRTFTRRTGQITENEKFHNVPLAEVDHVMFQKIDGEWIRLGRAR